MPEFSPERWHSCTDTDWQECDRGTNCYAYALDRPEYGWAVPGRGFRRGLGLPFFEAFRRHVLHGADVSRLRDQMIEGALQDGLHEAPRRVERAGHYLTALFFTPDDALFDFHWLRQEDDGTWSHKNGWRAPCNTNADGSPIVDPVAAARSSHPVLGGYFYVPLDGVILEETFPVE